MDIIERKLRRERKKKYKLLRKFRKARDIATKHTHRRYTCNYLRNQIRDHEEFDWFQNFSKDDLAVRIFEWSERERKMFQ